MNRDLMICKRILLQFVQSGKFATDDPVEAYHVALLMDRNYIEARLTKNEAGTPISAVIGRLTACGHDVFEAEFSNAVNQGSESASQDYYKILVENKAENDRGRDKVLLSVSTGGIALLFAIASFFRNAQVPFKTLPWMLTVGLWGTVLVGLLLSYHVAAKAIDKSIAEMNDSKCDVMHKQSWLDRISEYLNIYDCMAVVAGIVTFAWFILASI